MRDTPIFVARDEELARLDHFLNKAMLGQGQICFVTADAGSGKTTLTTEFARLAQERHNDLIVAVGLCDPQIGIGNPYLPFREMLGTLTGTLQSRQTAAATSDENTDRLQNVLRTSGNLLLEYGPDLIGTFVPGASLVTSIGLNVAQKAGWISQSGGTDSAVVQPDFQGVDQNQIFEQYVNVLVGLTKRAPLLLIIDDMQWADTSSIELLFHLTRRIMNSRIMILGTFRPEDIALERMGERHPLLKVLAELKRYHGDIIVDLDQVEQKEGLAFIDAYLDVEPNQLDRRFREALHRRTKGQPLFVVELLREMRERGDLVRNNAGDWITTDSLDWTKLPARAEGIIQERVGRLSESLRKILECASVQGDDFIAEIAAQIQNLDMRDFVRLSSELEQRHHLISSIGREQVGSQRVSIYQFQNRMFQQYSYDSMDRTERVYLHEDIGEMLETMYEGQTNTVAVQLAWHFESAGLEDRARPYLRLAGEQAAVQSANVEALDYLTRALALTPDTLEYADERYAILRTREQVYDLLGNRQAQMRDLDALEELVVALDDAEKQADVALQRANYAEMVSDYEAAIAEAQKAIALAQSLADAGREAAGQLQWGVALWQAGNFGPASKHLEQARALAQTAERPDLEANALRNLGTVSVRQGNLVVVQEYYMQALEIYQRIGDRRGQSATLNNLGIVSRRTGDFTTAQQYCEQALQLFQEIGDRRGEAMPLTNLGLVAQAQGNYARAYTYNERARLIYQEIGDLNNEIITLLNLGLIAPHVDGYAAALNYSEQALQMARDIQSRLWQGYAWTNVGHSLTGLGRFDKAIAAFHQAIDIRRELEQQHLVIESTTGLAGALLEKGDSTQALAHVDEILGFLETDTPLAIEEPFRAYATCYRVLVDNKDARARDVLTMAYNFLHKQALRIPDPTTRRVFLENEPTNWLLFQAYATGITKIAADALLDAVAPMPEPTPEPAAIPVAPPPAPEPAPVPVAPPPKAPAPPVEPPRAIEAAPAFPTSAELAGKGRLGQAWAIARTVVRLGLYKLRHLPAFPKWAFAAFGVGLVLAILLWEGWWYALPFVDPCPPQCEGIMLDDKKLLNGLDFYGSDMRNASIYEASMVGANMFGSNLSQALVAGSNLRNANLEGTNLTSANFVQTNLVGANLRGAIVRGADLSGALLVGADLRQADFRGAKLVGANLFSANLRGADLRGADLRGARLQVSRTPSGTVDYDALQDIAIAIEWDVRWLADADLTGTKYRARTSHIYCRPVCSGETDYPFLSSSTLLSATVGLPYVGIPEADTLQSTMEQIICNCPWTWFYLATRWPEGFTPPEEMISAN